MSRVWNDERLPWIESIEEFATRVSEVSDEEILEIERVQEARTRRGLAWFYRLIDPLAPTIKNRSEREVCEALERAGWVVRRSGWPDFVAFRGDEVRLIEVKPSSDRDKYWLSEEQAEVAAILELLGARVELLTPDDVENVDERKVAWPRWPRT